MQLYSTNNKTQYASLKDAVLQGLPGDNGLYMPAEIPQLSKSFFESIARLSFQEIAFHICKELFQGAIPQSDLQDMIESAVSFDAPLVQLDNTTAILELFHGPTLAFKDFGASFMAQLMAYLIRGENRKLHIFVATSGDTGGAVARGFLGTPGIHVTILYPSGKVSFLQEQQLTTLGQNITALEIDGTFDDCQSLVKQAFLDSQIRDSLYLTSANSINIARLIPQSFYYFRAYQQLKDFAKALVFSVPSGNFGNLSAGLFAQKMGLPVERFIAATNINDVVPEYLAQGVYRPRPSARTLSNAMDVGNPSNFARMLDLFGADWGKMQAHIIGYSFTDKETREAIHTVFGKHGYVIDPHGAVGYLAAKTYQASHPEIQTVVLETAHPAKFVDVVEQQIGQKVEIPQRLSELAYRKKEAVELGKSFMEFKEWIMGNLCINNLFYYLKTTF